MPTRALYFYQSVPASGRSNSLCHSIVVMKPTIRKTQILSVIKRYVITHISYRCEYVDQITYSDSSKIGLVAENNDSIGSCYQPKTNLCFKKVKRTIQLLLDAVSNSPTGNRTRATGVKDRDPSHWTIEDLGCNCFFKFKYIGNETSKNLQKLHFRGILKVKNNFYYNISLIKVYKIARRDSI